MDELIFLAEKEVRELDETANWDYISFLVKKIHELNIKAEKNCSECEKHLLAPNDINVELLFEDWRACQEHCDTCGKEERIFMCDVQLNLINHIAEAIGQLRTKMNGIVRAILSKDDAGEKLLSTLQKGMDEKDVRGNEMFL